MDKTIIALGLMSGTSLDGVDASLIRSDGEKNIEIIGNLYIEYDPELKKSISLLSNKIYSEDDLKNNFELYKKIERDLTIKHSEIAFKINKKFNVKANIIGFHGQTILHKPKEKMSIQIGDGQLLSQLLNTDVVYKFRKNDIDNGGEGAPLTPIYHHNLKKKLKINQPVLFLNIGGIANYTFSHNDFFFGKDVGPGNCLMDMYIKKVEQLDFDKDGNLARTGKIDNLLINSILDSEIYNTEKKHSLDIKDFVKGLQTEDALATLNYLTAKIITENIKKDINENFFILLCGGGRKNLTLVSNLKKLINNKIMQIDEYNINGDFVESQAFAYLSIRRLYEKDITFPDTTKVSKPVTGGEIIKIV